MKKLLSTALALAVSAASLTACGQTVETPPEFTGPKVVTTIFAPYDFTRQVAGEHAQVTMLLPPAAESHSFEPTPRDITTIQNCDIFVYVGGDSDSWVDGILESMDTSKMKIVTLMDCVELVEEEVVEGMEHDHDHAHDEDDHAHDEDDHAHDEDDHAHDEDDHAHDEDDHAHDEDEHHDEDAEHHDEDEHEDHDHAHEYDEHVWTSPRNAKLIVEKISEALAEVDPDHADAYRENTQSYLAKLDALDAQFRQVVAGAAHKTLVFGDRFPFRYFVDAYGLDYSAAFPGCSTESDASAATVKYLIDRVREEELPVVFHIELSNKRMAQTISEATGAQVRQLHAAHNITKEDFEAGKTYLDLMNENLEVLQEALN